MTEENTCSSGAKRDDAGRRACKVSKDKRMTCGRTRHGRRSERGGRHGGGNQFTRDVNREKVEARGWTGERKTRWYCPSGFS